MYTEQLCSYLLKIICYSSSLIFTKCLAAQGTVHWLYICLYNILYKVVLGTDRKEIFIEPEIDEIRWNKGLQCYGSV